MYISSRIFENKPSEICSRLNVKRQKAGKTENRTNEGKRMENSNNEKKRKKQIVALLVFKLATLEIVLERRKAAGRKGIYLAVTFPKIDLNMHVED